MMLHCLKKKLNLTYSETCLKRPLKNRQNKGQKDQKWVLKTNYRLVQVKSIAECSKGGILQYFRPALSYHMALRPLFCPFLSGRLKQVSLYPIF